MIRLLLVASQLCLAQTLDSDFVFSLSCSGADLSFYYQLAVAEATASFRGDARYAVVIDSPPDTDLALASTYGYIPLSFRRDPHGRYDPFPIFPLPTPELRSSTALDAFPSICEPTPNQAIQRTAR